MDTQKLHFENLPAQPEIPTQPNLNGSHVFRYKDTIFIRLPRELWRSAGTCSCDDCKGKEGFWDTLAIGAKPVKPGRTDYAWTVHCPPAAIRYMVEQKLKGAEFK